MLARSLAAVLGQFSGLIHVVNGSPERLDAPPGGFPLVGQIVADPVVVQGQRVPDERLSLVPFLGRAVRLARRGRGRGIEIVLASRVAYRHAQGGRLFDEGFLDPEP